MVARRTVHTKETCRSSRMVARMNIEQCTLQRQEVQNGGTPNSVLYTKETGGAEWWHA